MILLTGGSGRLGTELQKHIDVYAPTHAEFDVLAPVWPDGVDLVIHCAAYTDVLRAEHEQDAAYRLNVVGTENMTKYPLVYISTEYVFNGKHGQYAEHHGADPVNFYGMTKWLGELAARSAPRSLVVRTLFKERPFRHAMALTDQWTSGDYVDVIAPKIATAVRWFIEGRFADHDTIHIGTRRKSTYDLAVQTRLVEPISRKDILLPLPRDTSLDCSRYEAMLK